MKHIAMAGTPVGVITFSQSLISLPFLTTLILLLLLLLLVLLPLLRILENNQTESRLKLPPSPPSLPIIGNLHQLGKIPHLSLWKLSHQYGPVMFLKLGQIPTLVISSPEMAKEITKTNDLNCCTRPYSLGSNTLSYNSLDLAFCPYGDYWKEMRKVCVTELFTLRRVQSFSHIREKQMSLLVNSLSDRSSPKDPVNLGEEVFRLTYDIISQIAFGKIDEEKVDDLFKARGSFQETMNEAFDMLDGFWAADLFPHFGWIVDSVKGLNGKLRRCFRELDDFYEKVIEEHLHSSRPKPEQDQDIIDILIGLSKDETASSFRISKVHIKALLMNIFLGSIATTSITVVWAMTELTRNPRLMERVQREIRNNVGRKPKVAESEIHKLKYLKMVVKETFRLHPPIALLLPRESMRQFKLGAYDVYPKTRILINAWAIGRDPKAWKNPEEFYPERFEEDGSVDFRGNHFELLPFGAGRRICPGLTMGSINVELTLANLLHCFDWELPQGMKKEDIISLEEEAGLSVRKKSPLYLMPIKYDWQGQTL